MSPQITSFGQLAITSVEGFDDPLHRLAQDERPRYDDTDELKSNWNWLPVTAAIRREGETFVLDANSHAEKQSLKFSLRNPAIGSYELHSSLTPMEVGVTYSVAPIPRTETGFRFKPIMNCPTRFVVGTKTTSNPIKKIIGLTHFNEVEGNAT